MIAPISQLYKLFAISSVLFLMMLYFYRHRLDRITVIYTIIIVIILGILGISTQNMFVLILVCYIVCSDLVSFNKIVKTSMIATLAGMMTVFTAYFIGIVPDYSYH